MAEFPYSQAPNKLKTFFGKIQNVGKPDTIDKKWLASIGMTGSNDTRVITILKFIGFIDQANKPSERWINYRDKNRASKILAEGIVEGYKDLFQTYPDANIRSEDELKAFFSTKTKGGAQVIRKTATTFKTLCELADFEDKSVTNFPTQTKKVPPDGSTTQTKIIKELGPGVTVNINIQLTLPDTTDEDEYNKLFEAMKRHLLS